MHDGQQEASRNEAMNVSNLLAAQTCIMVDALPSIPTMNTTRLQLELLLQESSISLSAVSEIILSDAGATLQILRLIGEEFPIDEDRPTRMEDCLVTIGIERWLNTISASSMSPSGHVLAEWRYCHRVAQCARELAKCVDGLVPEEAYLIGLLCDVGKLPQLLGWYQSAGCALEQVSFGVMLAHYWHLPAYLLTAIKEQHEQHLPSRWSGILQIARQVAT